jgi:hypothetical protein
MPMLKRNIINRYESKYLIPPASVPEMREWMEPFVVRDPYGEGDVPEYRITTLQLDTPDLSFHGAKECEALDRFKLRVRTYREIGSSPVFTEIKAKYRHTIVKTRTLIPFDMWSECLVLDAALPDIFTSELQEIDFLNFRRIVWQVGAVPKILVRYIRESYLGTGQDYLRITFDRNLEYQPSSSWTDWGRSGTWFPMDSSEAQGEAFSSVVMEIKTLEQVPTWVLHLIETFDLQKTGNCKYSTGVWKEGCFDHSMPTRPDLANFFNWSI